MNLLRFDRIVNVPELVRNSLNCNLIQVRTKFANFMMLRDANRRIVVKERARDRLRINAMRKNTILPFEIREIADKMMKDEPINGSLNRLTYRCIITSRPRSNVHKWQMHRMVFRSLADYNKLSGVKRALWG